MNYKILTYEDYKDIVDISKNIWDGHDYLPKVFHKWVDEKEGCFLGLVKDNKVVAVGKYTILPDRQGWLEGLRVHINYRGQQLAHAISDMLFNLAREDLKNGKITNIAMCTHIDTQASIKMMEAKNFHLEQSCLVIFKDYELVKNLNLSMDDFKVENWEISYEDFKNLDYFKTCNNKLTYGFTFLNVCEAIYNDLVESNSLVIVNGHKCIVKMKGCPSIICIDNSFEGINDATNYYLLKYKSKEAEIYITNPYDELINKLKNNNFESIYNFEKDCVYYIYKD
ncbi:MAG: GNAT family N-acetyltransferase [Paraclostridium sp.]